MKNWLTALKTREATAPVAAGNNNFWRGLAIPELAGKTFAWYPSDSSRNFKDGPGQVYAADSFDYKFNAHGYRCDDFGRTGPSLCFVGCSITAGIGLPLTATWSWIFKTMVEEALGQPVVYWNLSHGGKSMSWMRRTFYLSRDVIAPDFTIAFFPEGNRDEFYKRNLISDLCYPHMPVEPEEVPGFVRMMSDEQSAGKMAHTLAMFDLALRGSPAGFAWGHWAPTTALNSAFDTFTGGRFDADRFWTNIDAKDYARDMMHPGPVTNRTFAEELYAEIGDRVVAKLREKCDA